MAALALGCASVGHLHPVETEYWKTENFDRYKRYAWLPSNADQRARTQAEGHQLHDLIREAIDEQLAAKGFERSPAADADFLVTYHCKVREELQERVIDRVWYGGESNESQQVTRRVELSPIDRGSLVIDFVKPDGSRWVWRGIARGPISPDATPAQLREMVDFSIREILSEFPPPR